MSVKNALPRLGFPPKDDNFYKAAFVPSADTPTDYPIGLRVVLADGREFVYCKSAASIVAGDAVAFALSSTPYDGVLQADSDSSPVAMPFGVALVAATTGKVFWAQTKGYCAGLSSTSFVNLLSSAVAPGDPLVISATAGRLTIAPIATDSSALQLHVVAICVTDGGSNLGSVILV